MGEKVFAKVLGASLMAAPIVYAGFSWIGRIGKTWEFNLLLTAIGAIVFVFGLLLFFAPRNEG